MKCSTLAVGSSISRPVPLLADSSVHRNLDCSVVKYEPLQRGCIPVRIQA